MAEITAYRAAREARRNTPAAARAREKAAERREERKAEQAEKRREADRLARLADADRVALWRQGAPVWLGYHAQKTDTGSAMVRLKPGDPDTVQTSQGAEVPAAHARMLWETILDVHAHNGEGADNVIGRRVGHFRVDAVRPDGSFVSGCHCFDWAEIEDFARRAGWAL